MRFTATSKTITGTIITITATITAITITIIAITATIITSTATIITYITYFTIIFSALFTVIYMTWKFISTLLVNSAVLVSLNHKNMWVK